MFDHRHDRSPSSLRVDDRIQLQKGVSFLHWDRDLGSDLGLEGMRERGKKRGFGIMIDPYHRFLLKLSFKSREGFPSCLEIGFGCGFGSEENGRKGKGQNWGFGFLLFALSILTEREGEFL